MNLIASADRNWGIGHEDALLVRIPADMKRFRRMTLGKTVVVGRRTLATFPDGKPLPKRNSIVLSATEGFAVADETGRTQVCTSLETALALLEAVPPEEVFIIGGQRVYEQFLPYCDTAYITRVDAAYPADRFLPALDQDPAWMPAERSEPEAWEGVRYWYETYRRIAADGA